MSKKLAIIRLFAYCRNNMSKVLITGGTGFIGANFAHFFVLHGDEVHLLVRRESNFWRIKTLQEKIHLHEGDLFDAVALKTRIDEIRPDVVLHFATYGAYPGREKDERKMIETNIEGTMNLIHACRNSAVQCFINTGSSSEYGEKAFPMREGDLLEPNNAYGVTKAAATLYAQYAAAEWKIPLVTMRLFSVYGPFEDRGRLIPNVMRACISKSPLELISPSIVRDFIFIDDVRDAYLKAIECIQSIKGSIFNIGSGEEHSIREVVLAMEKSAHTKIEARYGTMEAKQIEPKRWVADISKAKKLLGWEPRFSLERGLGGTFEWFQKNSNFYDEI